MGLVTPTGAHLSQELLLSVNMITFCLLPQLREPSLHVDADVENTTQPRPPKISQKPFEGRGHRPTHQPWLLLYRAAPAAFFVARSSTAHPMDFRCARVLCQRGGGRKVARLLTCSCPADNRGCRAWDRALWQSTTSFLFSIFCSGFFFFCFDSQGHSLQCSALTSHARSPLLALLPTLPRSVSEPPLHPTRSCNSSAGT
jgi:hypothetical protein